MSSSGLVTGGAGFIGSTFVLCWLPDEETPVLNFDKLTYAADLRNLASLENDPRQITTDCTNNYGPFQFPGKPIPLTT